MWFLCVIGRLDEYVQIIQLADEAAVKFTE